MGLSGLGMQTLWIYIICEFHTLFRPTLLAINQRRLLPKHIPCPLGLGIFGLLALRRWNDVSRSNGASTRK